MAAATGFVKTLETGWAVYTRCLRAVVYALVAVSGLGVLTIMLVTCADVILRLKYVNHPFVGAYDIVKIAGALTLATRAALYNGGPRAMSPLSTSSISSAGAAASWSIA